MKNSCRCNAKAAKGSVVSKLLTQVPMKSKDALGPSTSIHPMLMLITMIGSLTSGDICRHFSC